MTGIRLNHPLVIGALGGVLAACMACGILATGVAMLTPPPTPTAVIEPTPSGVPTSTPLPVVPTVTSVPTIVIQPTPTLTPTPSVALDEAAYIDSLKQPIDDLANGLVTTAQLLQSPRDTPQWRAELRQAIQLLSNAHYHATRITPPASWSAFHAALTRATYQCSMAGDIIYSAVSDSSYTQMALVAMERCTNLVADVSLEMERRTQKP